MISPFTKEKVLALLSGGLAAFVLAGVDLPRRTELSEPPPEEQQRAYRADSESPPFMPEKLPSYERDPFRRQDVWQPARPAPLPVPPARRWPRSLPGGLAAAPAPDGDPIAGGALPAGARLELRTLPAEAKKSEEGEQ